MALSPRALFFSAIVVGAGIAAWMRRAPALPTSVLDVVPLSRELERQSWPKGGVQAIASNGRPMLMSLQGSAIASLRCMNWSVEHLVAHGAHGHLNAFGRVSGSPTAEFVLARGRENEFERSRAVSTRQLSLRAFWERSVDPSTKGYEHLYHSGPLSSWPEQLGLEAEGVLEALSVTDAPAGTPPHEWPAPAGPTVWMGHAGVVATPHYDTSLNFVVQAFGTKRWRLWSPEQLPQLHMHPATHPSRRQARMQLSDCSTDGSNRGRAICRAYASAPALGVTLEQGDLLYVLTLWKPN